MVTLGRERGRGRETDRQTDKERHRETLFAKDCSLGLYRPNNN